MWRNILFIFVVVVLGYVSNVSSQSACLEDAVFWYSQVMMSGQPYYVVVLKADQEHIRHALDTVKASYTVLPSPSDPDAYPRVGIDTTSWLPFLISERFYFEGDETRGRRIYRPLSWFVWPGPLSGRFV